jgi:hypothetical protein
MTFRKKTTVTALGIIAGLLSCTKEFNDIDSQILPESSFLFENETFPVDVSHLQIDEARTDNLSLFQLGYFEDPVFGKTAAHFTTQITLPLSGINNFGSTSAEVESDGLLIEDSLDKPAHDEQETITSVWLEIPFVTNQRDSDGDGVIDSLDVDPNDRESDSDGDSLTDYEESRNPNLNPLDPDTDGDGINDDQDDSTVHPDPNANSYEIDLVYGDTEQVHFQVHKSDFYLRTLDPDANFEEDQAYFSDFDLLQQGLASTVLFDGNITLDFNEIVTYKEDDPDTEDVDESEEVEERLSPRIRIPLQNTALFQDILDKEGSSELENNEAFQTYFQGLVLSIGESSPVLMQLNFSAGQLILEYDYQNLVLKEDGDASNQDDYIVEPASNSFALSMGGVRFNTLSQSDLSSEVAIAVSGTDNQENIYLKGGLGVFAQIDLFSGAAGQALLEDLQSKPWLINETNLILYVDPSKTALMGNVEQPERLYLYDMTNHLPIIDYDTDSSSGSYSDQIKTNYGGIAQFNDAGQIVSYKFRLTNHLSNLLRNPEDFENVPLGLSVTSNILNTATTNTQDQMEVPASMISSPLGTILAGPNHQNPDLRLKLEVFYTEYQQ